MTSAQKRLRGLFSRTALAGTALLLPLLLLRSGPARASEDFREPVTGMEFVAVEGGTYMRGDVAGRGTAKERPPHPVTVSDFFLGRHEVTVAQFRAFADDSGYTTEAERAGSVVDIDARMNAVVRRKGISWKNPGVAQGDGDPVVWVSWNDARSFTSWLAGRSGRSYRLPTEAEWEYAARGGGEVTRWAGTSSEADLPRFAWFASNSGGRPHPVGGKEPNSLGLYDMSGNVWEWCDDWQERYAYRAQSLVDPRGTSPAGTRAIRGGSWRVGEDVVTTTYRNGYRSDYTHSSIGFRVALPGGDASAPARK